MIFDAVETAAAVLAANFSTDFTALASAKGVADLASPPQFVMRQKAEMFTTLGIILPAIGIYVPHATTGAKWQTTRASVHRCVFDWYARGTTPDLLAKQTELAAEVMLKTIDRLAGYAAGVEGAGELEDSITIDLTDGYDKTIEPNYDRRAVVTFPLNDRDSGL